MFLTVISPICDQGGECDLQDITLVYGSDKSRFYEYFKRAVFDKECGPFIKMIMTRCIHCTRCIRFLTEIDNDYNLGMLNRGNNSEISSFIKNNLINELSGNIIDLCPVGALTSKPFAFTARSWELNNLESIDILDSVASSIRVDFLNNKIYRVLPIYDRNLNEDWITNKIRFSYDCQNVQRLIYPLFKINNNWININWINIFYLFFFNFIYYIQKKNIYNFFGNFNDIITINNIKNFFNNIGLEINFFNNINLDIDYRFNYLINNYLLELNKIENILIIGLNLRIELPLLNTKINKKIVKYKTKILSNFENFNFSFNNNLLNLKSLIASKKKLNSLLLYKKINLCTFYLKNNYNSLSFLFGLNYFVNNNKYLLNTIYRKFTRYYKNFIVYLAISNISYLNNFEFNKSFKNYTNIKNSLIFLNNIDDEIFVNSLINKNNFIVYNGSFFDLSAIIANLIFPVFIFYEQNGLFINIYGNVRKLNKIISTNTFLYSSAELFNTFLIFINKKFINFSYFSKKFKKVIFFFKFIKLNWILNIKIYDYNNNFESVLKIIIIKQNINKIKFINNFIKSLIFNFYKNDIITKNSKNLHLASYEYLKKLSILNNN